MLVERKVERSEFPFMEVRICILEHRVVYLACSIFFPYMKWQTFGDCFVSFLFDFKLNSAVVRVSGYIVGENCFQSILEFFYLKKGVSLSTNVVKNLKKLENEFHSMIGWLARTEKFSRKLIEERSNTSDV